MRVALIVSILASAAVPCVVYGAGSAQPAPRPISEAERAAVELAADFAARGPEAIWDRLDAAAPLHALGRDAALLEVTARLGTREGVTWTLQSPPAEFGGGAALFHLQFPSGAEDLLRLEFATPGGGPLKHLWTLVDRPPPALQAPPARPSPARPAGAVAGPLGLGPLGLRQAAGLVAAAMIVLLIGARPERRRLRFAAGAILLAACAPAKNGAGPAPKEAFAPRLGELAPLRLASTSGKEVWKAEGAANIERTSPAARRVEQLWRAESALVQGDLARVDRLLGEGPPPADPPLASLLRARLGAARFRTSAVDDYDAVARDGFESDAWRLEQVGIANALEDRPLESAEFALRNGSRLAELWYMAAGEAIAKEQLDLAEARLRTAWGLRPLPRDEIFAEPALAALAARPALFPLFELGSPGEPIVAVTETRRALKLPAGATGRTCGRHYSIRIADFDLELPGGAVLATLATPAIDAASFRAETERRALASLASLSDLPVSPGAPTGSSASIAGVAPIAAPASASPVRNRLVEVAARALARDGKWTELLAATGGEGPLAAPPGSEMLGRLRALALRQVGRREEATAELLRLAQTALAGRRPFPGALYDLAELVAADGRYETAIRLVKKADAQVARPFGESRMKQFGLSLELERAAEEFRSPHFTVRFPAGGGMRYGRQIATVLEEERARLLQWIPQPGQDRIIVELLPLEGFLAAYAGEMPVLGLYDGRVRMPLADIQSLDPAWIALVSHELTHALLAAATRERAPHWLQEGLAQHAETGSLQVNPMPALEASGRTLSFPSLEPILKGFSEPQLVELAYSEAAWVVSYIESRGGAAALRRLVGAYAGGASAEAALATVGGLDMASFDAAFRSWAVHRAPAKRLIAPRRFDRELDRPFSEETAEADAGRRAVLGVRVGSSDPAPSQSAEQESAMRTWYDRYHSASEQARQDRARIDRVFRSRIGTPSSAECSAVRQSALALVKSHGVALGAPDMRLARELQSAYEELGLFGEICEQGKALEALDHYALAKQAFARAAALLEPFGLTP